MYDELSNIEEYAEYTIIVPRKKNTPPREATLQVKFKEVNIEPPNNLLNRSSYSKIKIYAVTTNEVNPPKDVEPVHWFILTTIPVLNFDDALEIIEWYRQRWVIEVLFEDHEWKPLHAATFNTKDIPEEVPSLSVVMRQIGKLGGHIGRKSDGYLGILTISKGLYQLSAISIIYKLLTCG